jgi:hypothetical protein
VRLGIKPTVDFAFKEIHVQLLTIFVFHLSSADFLPRVCMGYFKRFDEQRNEERVGKRMDAVVRYQTFFLYRSWPNDSSSTERAVSSPFYLAAISSICPAVNPAVG